MEIKIKYIGTAASKNTQSIPLSSDSEVVEKTISKLKNEVALLTCPNNHLSKSVEVSFVYDEDLNKFRISPYPITDCCSSFADLIYQNLLK